MRLIGFGESQVEINLTSSAEVRLYQTPMAA